MLRCGCHFVCVCVGVCVCQCLCERTWCQTTAAAAAPANRTIQSAEHNGRMDERSTWQCDNLITWLTCSGWANRVENTPEAATLQPHPPLPRWHGIVCCVCCCLALMCAVNLNKWIERMSGMIAERVAPLENGRSARSSELGGLVWLWLNHFSYYYY